MLPQKVKVCNLLVCQFCVIFLFVCRCLADYEKANKKLDMARTRNKDVAIAENRYGLQLAIYEYYDSLNIIWVLYSKIVLGLSFL